MVAILVRLLFSRAFRLGQFRNEAGLPGDICVLLSLDEQVTTQQALPLNEGYHSTRK